MKYTQNCKLVSPIPELDCAPKTPWVCFIGGFGLLLRRIWFKTIKISRKSLPLWQIQCLPLHSFVEEPQIVARGQTLRDIDTIIATAVVVA